MGWGIGPLLFLISLLKWCRLLRKVKYHHTCYRRKEDTNNNSERRVDVHNNIIVWTFATKIILGLISRIWHHIPSLVISIEHCKWEGSTCYSLDTSSICHIIFLNRDRNWILRITMCQHSNQKKIFFCEKVFPHFTNSQNLLFF